MRIGKVVGRVTLTQPYETLVGGRYLLAQVQDRFALAGEAPRKNEVIVVYDHLGAREGDMIGIAEWRQAAQPFYPEKRVPIDAYNAAILEAVVVTHQMQ
jgi:microcompartment protein CcmK/EutM